jgi:magnesium transporter
LFPFIGAYGDFLEEAELKLYDNASNLELVSQVRSIHRELHMLRRLVHPTLEVVQHMIHPVENRWLDEDEEDDDEPDARRNYFFSAPTRAYMADIVTNLERVNDLIETYKEICSSLDNIYSSHQEQQMNKTMYTLAVVSTVFLPLTFVAGKNLSDVVAYNSQECTV